MHISDYLDILAIDVGTETCKVGYCGSETPDVFESSRKLKYNFISPVVNSKVNNLDIYLDIVSSYCEGSPVILVENTFDTVSDKVLEYMMERRILTNILFVKSCIVEMFGCGKGTGILINMSGGSTQVCSIVDGLITSRKIMNFGGYDITKMYAEKLNLKLDFTGFQKDEFYRIIKEETITISDCTDIVFERGNTKVNVGSFRYEIPNLYFENNGIIEMYKNVLNENAQNIRNNLITNTVITGGARIRGISDKITSILQPYYNRIRVTEDHDFATYLGCSVLGSLGTTKQLFITIKDYEEYGVNILKRKESNYFKIESK